jgi:hypothetical protein
MGKASSMPGLAASVMKKTNMPSLYCGIHAGSRRTQMLTCVDAQQCGVIAQVLRQLAL